MSKKDLLDVRREKRVVVDLPVAFTLEDKFEKRKVSYQGRIDDLSIEGMRIELPLSAELFEMNDPVDFSLDLPIPFKAIKGHGCVQWKRWDANKNCTTCGLKLELMNLDHLSDIDIIIQEINEKKKS